LSIFVAQNKKKKEKEEARKLLSIINKCIQFARVYGSKMQASKKHDCNSVDIKM
jgi:hypothetical protein